MATPAPTNKRKVLCPECDKEVEITRDAESGDDEGICGECGLNVGRILTRRRYDRAYNKVAESEKAAEKKTKKAGGLVW